MFNLDLGPYIIDLIYENISGVRREGDKLHFSCPLCDDHSVHKKRGWYYIKTNSFFCWNAGCPANNGITTWKYLSLLTGKPENEVKVELIKRAGSFTSLSANANIESAENIFDDINSRISNMSVKEKILDDNWTEILPDIAVKVLTDRKILKAPYLGDLKFYYNKKSKRLVIPWSDDYWQERALFKYQEEKEAKYLFPSGENIEKPIFGLKNADLSGKNIFILEGLFDSIFVKGGIAAGSITMSAHQKKLLEPYAKTHEIILFMDNQWIDETSIKESEKILKTKPAQKIFIWPEILKKYKDVNDTVKKSDKMIDIWKNDRFLESRVFSGLRGIIELEKIKKQI